MKTFVDADVSNLICTMKRVVSNIINARLIKNHFLATTTLQQTPSPRTLPSRVVGTTFPCARGCSSRDLCPSRNEIHTFLNGTVRACGECVMDECGK